MIPQDDLIALGVIRKPHGLRGEASIELWTESSERLEDVVEVTLVAPDDAASRKAGIESWRHHGERVLVKFRGIDTPEDVALLRDWTIEIPAAAARKPAEGEYFLHDLAGLIVVDAAGAELGVVTVAYEGGGGVLLEVKSSSGRTFEVPFAESICTSIDLAAKRIVVDLPEGLDEI